MRHVLCKLKFRAQTDLYHAVLWLFIVTVMLMRELKQGSEKKTVTQGRNNLIGRQPVHLKAGAQSSYKI